MSSFIILKGDSSHDGCEEYNVHEPARSRSCYGNYCGAVFCTLVTTTRTFDDELVVSALRRFEWSHSPVVVEFPSCGHESDTWARRCSNSLEIVNCSSDVLHQSAKYFFKLHPSSVQVDQDGGMPVQLFQTKILRQHPASRCSLTCASAIVNLASIIALILLKRFAASTGHLKPATTKAQLLQDGRDIAVIESLYEPQAPETQLCSTATAIINEETGFEVCLRLMTTSTTLEAPQHKGAESTEDISATTKEDLQMNGEESNVTHIHGYEHLPYGGYDSMESTEHITGESEPTSENHDAPLGSCYGMAVSEDMFS
jgi:hypothetical protein